MKFSVKDFFSKCDEIRRKIGICSHLLQKSLTENFIFRAVKKIIPRSIFDRNKFMSHNDFLLYLNIIVIIKHKVARWIKL